MRKKYKIETYLPKEALENIKNRLYNEGLGKIGNYDCCLSWSEVNSSWRPNWIAKPYLGKTGQLERASEYKLEFVCEKNDLQKAIQIIKENHPYEEVCINIFKIFA